MTGISASDIAGVQAAVTALLPDTATIKRSTGQTSDGMGGVSGTLTTVATAPCLITDHRPMASERIAAERVNSEIIWLITFPAATDVQAKDVIVVGARTFQAQGVFKDSYETDRRVICAEAEPA